MQEVITDKSEYLDEARHERELRYDLTTQFAEVVNGNMRTDFELFFDNQDLIGEDGRAMGEVSRIGIEDAKKIAKESPKLKFEVRRRGCEEDERGELIEMCQGERPNTMVVVSDFPAELMEEKEDIGGYNVRRKQTMLRVLIRKPNGNIHMYSQSLDGSNRQALEAIYNHFGVEPEPGELLGQRLNIDLPWEQQTTLVDELTGVYDRSLTEQFEGEWYAGRMPADYSNTYDFVCKQNDLIDECVRLDNLGWLNDQAMWKIAATMQKRFQNRGKPLVSINSDPGLLDPNYLYREIEMAANRAESLGLIFSACGVTLTVNGIDGSTENKLEQAGYGNKDDKCEFTSKQCPECGKKDVKTIAKTLDDGSRHVSGSCGCKKTYAKSTIK